MKVGISAALLFAACAAAQEGSLAGLAIDAATGQPLPGAHLRLIPTARPRNEVVYGAMSDDKGRLSIARIPPGIYYYQGERTGYLSPRQGSMPFGTLRIKPGEHVTDFKLEMSPRSTVSGHVYDQYGDPVPTARVELRSVSADGPGPPIVQLGGNTDDRGEFHLPVARGKYYVLATPQQAQTNVEEIRTDGTVPANYGPTYYPSSPAIEGAAAVEVGAGVERAGVDIRLSIVRAAGGITGIVTGMQEGRTPMVMVSSGEKPGQYRSSQSNSVSPDGRFSFHNLAPGYYRLQAFDGMPNPELCSQPVEFEASSAPSTVELRLAPGSDLSATVVVEGEKLPAAKRTLRLEPGAQGPMFGPLPSAPLDAEGAAPLKNVFPGKYRVNVQPLPDNAYVESVEVDGVKSEGGDIELRQGFSKLKVKLRGDGGELSGRMLDRDGSEHAGFAMILLVPAAAKTATFRNLTGLGQDGRFRFHGVRPGRHKLIAFDTMKNNGITDPESLLAKYGAKAEEVEIKPGDRLVHDVHAVNETTEGGNAPKQ